jgi:hypothetical protein
MDSEGRRLILAASRARALKAVISLVLFALIICLDRSAARGEPPETRQAAEIFSLIQQAGDMARFKVNSYEVRENALFPSSRLATKHLVFGPNSTLLISDEWTRSPVLLMADEIEVHGNATITWTRRDVTQIPPDRGRAQDGAAGRGDGANGSDGADGQPGNIGYPGRAAPSLYLFARKIMGGSLFVDLRGESGGAGGRGQDGGRGGDGAKGAPASQSLLDCKRGPGMGGNGGKGGNAGPGGMGGAGGEGGDLLVIGLGKEDLSKIQLHADGGAGGKAGAGGNAGKPGAGGPEGEAQAPFCTGSGRSGSFGQPGADDSQKVLDGAKGDPGKYIFVPLDPKLLTVVFGPN